MKHFIQLIINALARRLKLYGTLDTDKAIRVVKRQNLMLKEENLRLTKELVHRPGFTTVYIDPLMRQRGYAQSAWAEPERHTDKPTVIPNPQGRYFQARHQEFLETREQPIMKPSRTFTTCRLERYDGPPSPGETLHRTPAFLQDQDKKIS